MASLWRNMRVCMGKIEFEYIAHPFFTGNGPGDEVGKSTQIALKLRKNRDSDSR